ncbi:cell division protein PerM [Actinophytocola gossypii]|uniref:Uncharacterized protein n=1 Tax=Actinophytocola gossypii TaxID=2812003 RepID=A0ABT2JDW7_9PSEU|nr:DUF6350 family protein [Actinophytocola gossypii]MCT2586062.1 hypothetical protein [Actinophytocola gossypii]
MLDLDAVERSQRDVDESAVSRLTRFRVLALAATAPLVTGYAAVAAVLALVTAVAPLTHFSTAGVLGAALPGWLAAHQVPVGIGGFEFGALPLLPTLLVLFLAARAAAGAADRLGYTSPREAGHLIGAIALTHGVCALVVALVYTGRNVDVDPLAAFYYPALLAVIGATAGVPWRCGLVDALARRADAVAVRGLAAGAVAVALLLVAGAAVFTFGLLTSTGTARDLFATAAPGAGSGLGMLLLCLGYLPNAVIAGTSFVAGPGFALGEVAFSPVELEAGPVPALPLLAALPEEQASWWPALCLLPLAVGVLVGRRLRYVADDPVTRMRAVAVAAGAVALTFAVLAGSAGGRLGVGPFDPVTMRAAAVSVALVLWIGVPAAAVAWFTGPRPLHDPIPGLIPADEDDEGEEDEESEGETRAGERADGGETSEDASAVTGTEERVDGGDGEGMVTGAGERADVGMGAGEGRADGVDAGVAERAGEGTDVRGGAGTGEGQGRDENAGEGVDVRKDPGMGEKPAPDEPGPTRNEAAGPEGG